MRSKLINDGPQKTYVLVLDKGDEAVATIEGFARETGIAAAQLTGIGAFSDAVLGFFNWETKDYRKIPVTEQVEVVSLLGDVALGPDGKSALHPHVVDEGQAALGILPLVQVAGRLGQHHFERRADMGCAADVADE